MVDSENAMPVAVIGPFIDRLDHIQHKLLKDPNSRIDSMRAMLSDHEARLIQLQASFSSTVSRPADMSHRGPGSVARTAGGSDFWGLQTLEDAENQSTSVIIGGAAPTVDEV